MRSIRHVNLKDEDFDKTKSIKIEQDEFSITISQAGRELFGIQYNAEIDTIQVVKWDDDGDVVDDMSHYVSHYIDVSITCAETGGNVTVPQDSMRYSACWSDDKNDYVIEETRAKDVIRNVPTFKSEYLARMDLQEFLNRD